MPEPLPLTPTVALAPAGYRFEFTRSSGPGGQNVNKLATRATLRVSLDALADVLPGPVLRRLIVRAGSRVVGGELVLSSEASRSQVANREDCAARLRAMVRASLRPPKPRIATKPTRASRERRLDAKKQQGQRKQQRASDRRGHAE